MMDAGQMGVPMQIHAKIRSALLREVSRIVILAQRLAGRDC